MSETICRRCVRRLEPPFGTGPFAGLCLTCAEQDYLGVHAEKEMLASFVGKVSRTANTWADAACDLLAIMRLSVEPDADTVCARLKRLTTEVGQQLPELDALCGYARLPRATYDRLSRVRDILRGEVRRAWPQIITPDAPVPPAPKCELLPGEEVTFGKRRRRGA